MSQPHEFPSSRTRSPLPPESAEVSKKLDLLWEARQQFAKLEYHLLPLRYPWDAVQRIDSLLYALNSNSEHGPAYELLGPDLHQSRDQLRSRLIRFLVNPEPDIMARVLVKERIDRAALVWQRMKDCPEIVNDVLAQIPEESRPDSRQVHAILLAQERASDPKPSVADIYHDVLEAQKKREHLEKHGYAR